MLHKGKRASIQVFKSYAVGVPVKGAYSTAQLRSSMRSLTLGCAGSSGFFAAGFLASTCSIRAVMPAAVNLPHLLKLLAS